MLALLLLAAPGGCSGCHEDHPYVPYAIGPGEGGSASALDAAVASTDVSPGAGDAGTFFGEVAVAAPPGLARWPIGGVTVEAPADHVFVSALVTDFDGDGAKDAFAIVRSAAATAAGATSNGDPGELVYLRGGAGGGELGVAATYPPVSGLAHEPSCVALDRLVRVGRRAVLVELGSRCGPPFTGAPARWVAVVAAPTAAGPRLPDGVRFAATVVDPPGAPSLTVDAETVDRDGDALPDVTLRVSLEGGSAPLEPGPKVTATLAWLDRPAGLSRDAAATDASFAALATSAAVRARSRREASTVPGLVAQSRALWRAICADGGAPRLLGVTGSGPITCGDARPLEDLGLAEVRAFVTLADPLRASLALDRAERPPAAHTSARITEATGWITPLAPVATARSVRSIAAVPLPGKGHEPSWGALAFETEGKLLVRTRAGVVRVDPDAGDEASADGVSPWPAAVVSLDARVRWIETYDPCDGVALRASFASSSGDDLQDVALPVAPPLGDHCVGSRGTPARALPIAWGPKGLEAIVAGELLLVAPDLSRATSLSAPLDSPALLGAPRSPDGRALVVAVSIGLLVRGQARTRILRAAELDGTYAQLRDCAVSNDQTHVACVRADKAWVGVWDAP